MITREQMVEIIKSYIGTRFLHQARVKGEVIDCAGLLLCVGKEANLVPEKFDFTGYREQNDGTDLERIIRMFADEINIEDRQDGDILTLMVTGYPQHAGFEVDKGLIHAVPNDKVRYDGWNVCKYEKRIYKAFHLRGVV